jgi:RNA polymerase sigma factor (sigma-70 family)
MEITDKDIKRWHKLSNVITSGDDYISGEILSTFLETITKKMKSDPTFIFTDNYVFISLKNININYHTKNKRNQNWEDYNEYDSEIEEYDYNNDKKVTKETYDKLNSIDKVVSKLGYFDSKLYELHYVNGVPQREIARKTDIQLSVIHYRLSKIKNKIREVYGEN